MKPFEIEASLRKLLVHYPDPALLLQVDEVSKNNSVI